MVRYNTPRDTDLLEIIRELQNRVERIERTGRGATSLRTYSFNTTWVKPDGLRAVRVRLVGGGASGGGCAATSSSQRAEAGGGGAGGYSEKLISVVDLGDTEPVTVGAGGAGASPGANDGNPGGTSSYGSHLSASGGSPGGGSAAFLGAAAIGGGVGGVGSGGDINTWGGTGGAGVLTTDSNRGFSNLGAGSVLGATCLSYASSSSGAAGRPFGSGSSGARQAGSQSARGSTSGYRGIVIVEEYY
jgi:hypothetical protein